MRGTSRLYLAGYLGEVGLFAVVISTKTRAREFKFGELDEVRDVANDVWRWVKGSDEHGSITLYERHGVEWVLTQDEQV